jgi:copper chaperone CopZ
VKYHQPQKEPETMETKKVALQIEGMSCLSCAATAEKSLSKVGGVSNPAVNFTTGKASLE